MKLFLYTATSRRSVRSPGGGMLSGVTTNPMLIHPEGLDPGAGMEEILAEVEGDVSLKTTKAAVMYEREKFTSDGCTYEGRLVVRPDEEQDLQGLASSVRECCD